MGFMGGIFKALGFESESKSKIQKKKKTKASFSLKKGRANRVDEIDGVPVYYPESFAQVKDFVDFVQEGKAVIISKENLSKEDGERVLNFLDGFVYGAKCRLINLAEENLLLILPEGMEVEE